MRKLFLFIALAMGCATMNAQQAEEGTVTLTPQLGLVSSKYGNKVVYETLGETVHTSYRTSFTAGAELGYQANSWFKPSIGLMYVNSGSRFQYKGYTIANFDNHYLNIPVIANFYLAEGFAVKCGIQPSILLSAKEKDSGEDVKDGFKAFDLQIPVGLSYEYSNIVVDARYNIGLMNILKDDYEKSSAGNVRFDSFKNMYFTVTFGYRFDFE